MISDLFEMLGDLGDFAEFVQMIARILHDLYLKWRTRHWPVTPIVICSRRQKEPGKIALTFTYSVDGERYGGNQDHIGRADPIMVRYDPKRPERSWIP